MLTKTIKQMKKEITQEDYNNMKEARDYFMEKYNNLKTLNMNTTTTDKQKIKKIADIITDNFNEQITDLLTTYNIQTETEEEEEKRVEEVIKEIIKIYK
jgi:hypothetical protein